MSATTGPGETGRQPTEEELRAAYEEQIKQLRVEHILLDNVVALINLGMRRTGLAPGTESERDMEQVRLAIESVRALMPQLEHAAPAEIDQVRSALSQLQLYYVRVGGQAPAAAGAAAGGPGGPGSAGAGPESPAGGTGSPPGGAGSPPGGPGSPPGGAESPPGGPGAEPPQRPAGPGPAQRSGRLWVPGQ